MYVRTGMLTACWPSSPFCSMSVRSFESADKASHLRMVEVSQTVSADATTLFQSHMCDVIWQLLQVNASGSFRAAYSKVLHVIFFLDILVTV